MVQPPGSCEAGNSWWWWYSDAFPWNINPFREYREQKGSRWLSSLCVQHSSHLLAALTTQIGKRGAETSAWVARWGFLQESKGKAKQSTSLCPKQKSPDRTCLKPWPGSENGCPDISGVGSLVFGSGRLRLQVRGCPGAAGSVWGAQGKDTGCPRAASSMSCLSRRFLRSEGNATGRLCPNSSGKFFLCVINRGST